jgi:hypothetical protein
MKLTEILGDPELYRKRSEEAARIIRSELDRRRKNIPPPGGVERRTEKERREGPLSK